MCNSSAYSLSVEQWFMSQASNPQQRLRVSNSRAAAPVRAQSSNTVPKQGLPVRHERAVATVSVQVVDITPTEETPVSYGEAVASVRPVGGITPRHGPPATSAEAVASIRPVVNLIRVSVSRRCRRRRTRQESALQASSPTPAPPLETLHVFYMTGDGPSSHPLQVPSPPCYASAITQLPELLLDEMLRALKREDMAHLCVVVQAPVTQNHERSEGMEPKSAREEHLETQSWEELDASENLFSRSRASFMVSSLTPFQRFYPPTEVCDTR